MRIDATPDIAGNAKAIAELRAGLASAIAVAAAESHVSSRMPDDEGGDPWVVRDIVGQVTIDAAPRVAEFLERAIAEQLARRRLYGLDTPREESARMPDAPPWLSDRPRRTG
jgi:hypothetical protein